MSKSEFKGTPLTRYLFGEECAKHISKRELDGQSWYMAADICGQVGMASHSQAVRRVRARDVFTLESHEWRKESIYIGGRTKKHVLLVNNGGMLKLIYQSQTATALAVQERVANIPEDLFPAEWQEYLSDIDD